MSSTVRRNARGAIGVNTEISGSIPDETAARSTLPHGVKLVHAAGMSQPSATGASGAPGRTRRNKSFDATHQTMIEAAVRLISEKGVEALSITALARAVGLNRATVYYHFADREALLEAVSAWSSDQLVTGFTAARPQPERIDFIGRFVLENPDLIKLWIENFISPGDIRDHYPKWDEFVSATAMTFGDRAGGEGVDVEVHCTMMLVAAIIGPRVFRGSVRPELDDEAVIGRFRKEHQRMLRRDGLLQG